MAPHPPILAPDAAAPSDPPSDPSPDLSGQAPWSDDVRLGRFARLVHDSLRPAEGATHLLAIQPEPPEGASLGFWEVPDDLDHPTTPLVGFRAPSTWVAAGLHVRGRRHDLAEPESAPTPVVSTIILAANGTTASVLEGPDGIEVITGSDGGTPVGVVADVLARVLGLATPPPDRSPATYLDACWLDRVAATALDRPAAVRSWRWLADRHPLRGTGPVPEPAQLASRARNEALRASWSTLLDRFRNVSLPAAEWGPPGGTVLSAGEWFDEGSLSRWLLRSLPPVEALRTDLLAVLPPALGEQLVDGLAAA